MKEHHHHKTQELHELVKHAAYDGDPFSSSSGQTSPSVFSDGNLSSYLIMVSLQKTKTVHTDKKAS
ncbi:Hypothetical predicted protein [Xyrichtys novacula]|uniref:Uncharacterized protein n=1 Tax=Xyrichtys novacula TaxID=13765 RepID=A0AAV1EZ27_XYRNO|nr:Hypothetical predicted protein [Xyrichtys novacula]